MSLYNGGGTFPDQGNGLSSTFMSLLNLLGGGGQQSNMPNMFNGNIFQPMGGGQQNNMANNNTTQPTGGGGQHFLSLLHQLLGIGNTNVASETSSQLPGGQTNVLGGHAGPPPLPTLFGGGGGGGGEIPGQSPSNYPELVAMLQQSRGLLGMGQPQGSNRQRTIAG